MIWCLERDPSMRNLEVYALQSAGFEAKGFEDHSLFWDALHAQIPQLAIIDAPSPGSDSLDLLKKIRACPEVDSLPVIMSTGQAEYDVIRCLDAGADDCLCKPFGMMEMVSRVRAVLRRCHSRWESALRVGDILLDPDAHTVLAGGEKVTLTYKEFQLLRLFMEHPGEVFSREQLYQTVWKGDYNEKNRTVDIHIQSLRKKLGSSGKWIESIRYIGYRMKKR